MEPKPIRLRPLDVSSPNHSLLRRYARQSLENTASPMFTITNFGFEQLLQSVVARASSSEQGQLTSAGRGHFDLKTSETEDDAMFTEFREEMQVLAQKVAAILFGDEIAQQVVLDGPLSVKSYVGRRKRTEEGTGVEGTAPPSTVALSTDSQVRLGAHIDGNFFTLLWSNAPGLQVLNPKKVVTAEELMYYGMPLVGEATSSLTVKEEDFVDVEAEWASGGVMLVTVGRSWFSSTNPLTQDSDLKVTCPVLHRVAFPDSQIGTRFSIPFLVNVVEAVEVDGPK